MAPLTPVVVPGRQGGVVLKFRGPGTARTSPAGDSGLVFALRYEFSFVLRVSGLRCSRCPRDVPGAADRIGPPDRLQHRAPAFSSEAASPRCTGRPAGQAVPAQYVSWFRTVPIAPAGRRVCEQTGKWLFRISYA